MEPCRHDDDKCEYWYMGMCELDDRLNVCPHSELYEQLQKFGGHINEPKEPEPASTGGLLGWICPKCGAALSPFVNYCVKCSGNWEITFNGGVDIAHSSAYRYTTEYTTECNGGNSNG